MSQTLSPTRATIPLAGGTAATAVFVMFAVNGMLLGGYGGSLPSVRERLDLDATQIAIMLFCGGVAGIVSMQIGGRLADSIGARRVVFAGLPILIAAALVLAFAPTYPVAILAAAMFGLGNGAMDVAMNALGVQVEAARRKPIMSRFHAFFSVGNFIGAGTVLLMALALGITGSGIVAPLMITLAVIAAIVFVVLLRISPEAALVDHSTDGVKTKIPTMAWVLGAMALAFGLSEGTAVDWSSLHVTDVGNVSPSTGAWGLACVSGFMVVIRLCGDYVVERLGRPFVVRTGSACALVGYLFTVFGSGLAVILVGWCLVGLGVGLVAPQIYGLAGHVGGGRGLAVVVSFGYAAFLIGPAIIGFVVSHSGLQRAMLVPVVTAVGLIVMSTRLPSDPTDHRPEPAA